MRSSLRLKGRAPHACPTHLRFLLWEAGHDARDFCGSEGWSWSEESGRGWADRLQALPSWISSGRGQSSGEQKGRTGLT